MCLFAIGIESLLDVHLIGASANKNPRRPLEQTAGACEQGMERGHTAIPNQSGSACDELAAQVVAFLEDCIKNPEPMKIARGLLSARTCCALLARAGYRPFFGFVRGLDESLDKLAAAARRGLVGMILRGQADEAEAERALLLLSEQIDSGAWADWEQDIDRVEAAVIAAKAAG